MGECWSHPQTQVKLLLSICREVRKRTNCLFSFTARTGTNSMWQIASQEGAIVHACRRIPCLWGQLLTPKGRSGRELPRLPRPQNSGQLCIRFRIAVWTLPRRQDGSEFCTALVYTLESELLEKGWNVAHEQKQQLKVLLWEKTSFVSLGRKD